MREKDDKTDGRMIGGAFNCMRRRGRGGRRGNGGGQPIHLNLHLSHPMIPSQWMNEWINVFVLPSLLLKRRRKRREQPPGDAEERRENIGGERGGKMGTRKTEDRRRGGKGFVGHLKKRKKHDRWTMDWI